MWKISKFHFEKGKTFSMLRILLLPLYIFRMKQSICSEAPWNETLSKLRAHARRDKVRLHNLHDIITDIK